MLTLAGKACNNSLRQFTNQVMLSPIPTMNWFRSENNDARSGSGRAVLISTAYCPPVAWMAVVLHHKHAAIEVYETYPRQTWRNRCRIMTANGLLDLIIPVTKPHGNYTLTRDVVVSDHTSWQRHHWRSIVSAYQRAPYFIYYASLLESIYQKKFTGKLVDWNRRLFDLLNDELELDISLTDTSSYTKQENNKLDFREILSPKRNWPDSGKSYIWPSYQQVFSNKHGFAGNLGAIDLMFNLGPDTKTYLEECVYRLGTYDADG